MSLKFLNTILLLTIIFTAFSCKEIIDIDTISANPQIVVEASIGLNESPVVYLTKTINIDNLNNFPPVINAIVKITDNNGKNITLTESSPGQYVSTTSDLNGVVGNTYNLSVETDTKNITATSTIPTLVKIDSIKIVNSIYPGGGSPTDSLQEAKFYEIKIKYTDPQNEENFYRFIVYLNGKASSGNNIFDDRLTNGKQVERNLVIYIDEIKAGDAISVEMQCIDKPVYEYFKSMGNSMSPRNASSPANPYTNLSGCLLGIFSAHTSERREFILN